MFGRVPWALTEDDKQEVLVFPAKVQRSAGAPWFSWKEIMRSDEEVMNG
tara:strand:- start:97145 stop:97291 length:147 start_codon:yes stop_codon:yes gene_type:complete